MKIDNKGVVLISTLGLIGTMATLGTALLAVNIYQVRSAERYENRMIAFQWAEGGIDRTIVELKNDPNYSGLASTSAITDTLSGKYATVVTPTAVGGRYEIQASSSAGDYSSSYGYQQRAITAVVQMPFEAAFPAALFAQSNITMTGNAQTDAYDSREGDYNSATATADGDVGTNGTSDGIITLTGNPKMPKVQGDATVGPGANIASAIDVTGDAQITGTKSAADEMVNLSPVTVPSTAQSLSAISLQSDEVQTLSAGTYTVSSLSITGNGQLVCTGKVTLYVTGAVSVAGNGVGTADHLPTNFYLHVQGNHAVSLAGNGNFYGAVYAPESAVSISGNGAYFGAVVGNTISNTGNGGIHYDKALEANGEDDSAPDLISWKEQY